jgi:iron complex outermembrane recepter protein
LSEIWSITGSFGKALRFPTVGELYQTVQTGTTFVQANPFLKPESVLSGELALERDVRDGKLRLSVFDEYVSDALISQTSTVPGFATPVSFTQNVGKTREVGAELAGTQDNVPIRGLSLSGSVTYVNARILEDDGFVSTTPGDTAVGKQVPNVPTWRTTLEATYRPDNRWAYTLAARYSSRMFWTVDKSDINPATGLPELLRDGCARASATGQALGSSARRRQPEQPQVLPVPPVSATDLLCRAEIRRLNDGPRTAPLRK